MPIETLSAFLYLSQCAAQRSCSGNGPLVRNNNYHNSPRNRRACQITSMQVVLTQTKQHKQRQKSWLTATKTRACQSALDDDRSSLTVLADSDLT